LLLQKLRSLFVFSWCVMCDASNEKDVRYTRGKKRCAVRYKTISWLVLFFLLSGALGFAAQPGAVEVSKSASTESIVAKAACELICQGQFDAAGELIKQTSQDAQKSQLAQLTQIVQEYQAVNQRRQSARGAAYKEQLAELEKFRVEADTNDAGDVNSVSVVFSVVARMSELADEQQKSELLSDPFVKQTIRKAIDKASEFEAKGKWLDAYITCYRWLQVIDENNEACSEHAEQLYEKANIVASFQDSPCETRRERYEKIEEKMFIRAIDALNFNYVNAAMDYKQMAAKAIRRCELLAEAMKDGTVLVKSGQKENYEDSFSPPDSKKLAAWSAGLSAILNEVNQSPTGISKDKFIDVFEKVLTLNVTTAELPRPVLIAHFAEAALSALDPYTVMIWPRQVEDFEKQMTNEFTGVGIEISKEKGLLTAVSLLPDTPAYNSGLDAGDVIEAVDGVATSDMSITCAVKNITGPAGTKVTLTVRSPGQERSREITITRAKITVPTIRGWQRTEAGKWLYMIDERNKIGYVRITSFSDKTADDFEKVLDKLESEGLKGLILDLRFNSGGLLDSAVEVADKFLKEGLIVSTRPRFGVWTYAAAHEQNTHPNYPLVVLINNLSASASEIVAGALQDKAHKRAMLVGERSLGKGSVQGITAYPQGRAQLKYTMAYYHLPSGQRVESQDAMKKQGRKDWGVGPDVEVKLRSDELKKMSDVQKDNDVLVKAGHDSGIAPLKKHTAEETLAADPQLAVGVLVVKTKLVEDGV
jgi:carboxyl-terminal processing protease